MSPEPDAPSARRDPVEELAEEFLERYRRGERPALAEFFARAPEHADEIRELFPALVLMEQACPAEPSASPPSLAPLERLGEYRIIREVGRGGMGVVYEADQEALGRHVALKVLPSGAADARAVLRFRREARAAARLHHTNIVPVFDVGQREGLHYYAMQFIAGQGLDQVIRELRRLRSPDAGKPAESPGGAAADLADSVVSGRFRAPEPGSGAATVTPAPTSPAEATAGSGSSLLDRSDASSRAAVHFYHSVARIGRQAASALAYAHGQRVLHRDVKPSNLLLDTAGIVWITDFGLAKEEGDDLTRTGDVVGTLRYIAPERFSGPADARSDVYSLGLTLYELITLRPAFAETDRVRLVQAIAHREPEAPRKIDPQIPRDLETIVLKAISKEPARRYARADDLEADLNRFLLDRPIEARRASGWERAWRWCRRNPAVASLAASLVLIVVGSMAGLTALYVRANAERRRAEGAEENWKAAAEEARRGEAKARESEAKARQAAAESKSVLNFFQERVLSAARPKGLFGGLGKDATIRAALEQAEPEIAKSFANQPLVEATVRQALGNTYAYLDQLPRAVAEHERALHLREEYLPPGDPEVLLSAQSLAQDHWFAGHLEEAERLFRRVLTQQKMSPGPDAYQTLTTMNRLGNVLMDMDRKSEALPLFEEAYRRARAALGPEDADTIVHLSDLGRTYQRVGRVTEAVPLLEEAVRLNRKKLGPKHNDTIRSMSQLAEAYRDAGRSAEAARLWEEAVATMRESMGPTYLSTLALKIHLASLYRETGRPNDAIPMLEDVLRALKARPAPDHPRQIVCQSNLAAAYREVGRLDEALAMFDDTLRSAREHLGPGHQTSLTVMTQTTSCLLKARRFEPAEVLARESFERWRKKAPDDWRVFHAEAQVGRALAGLKRYAEAEKVLAEAYVGLDARASKIPALSRGCVRDTAQALADLYDAWGKPEQASVWRRKDAADTPPAAPVPRR